MSLKSFLKTVKLQESTLSMLFGVLVVLIAGFAIVRIFAQYKQNAPDTLPITETVNNQENSLEPQTHTVSTGESLWTIAEKYYGTGYKWVDIKEANNLRDANGIAVGQELIIPNGNELIAQANSDTENQTEPLPSNELESQQENTQVTNTDGPSTSEIQVTKNNTEKGTHIVLKGESLWKIAQQYYNDGNKWVNIAKANNLETPSVITAGVTLEIPDNETTLEQVQVQDTDTYVVKSGDTLWDIAQNVLGDGNRWTEISKANNLTQPSIIHTGNTLKIPR